VSGTTLLKPVWVGVAMRMEDGSLYVVEMDEAVRASIDETFESLTFRTFEPTGTSYVKFAAEGIGRRTDRFDGDMGASRIRARRGIGSAPAIALGR
jgi:hypothetical protein